MTTWPEDGGPFVTLPLVFTQHPDGRGHNLGIIASTCMTRAAPDALADGKGGGFHYQVAEARAGRCRSRCFSADLQR